MKKAPPNPFESPTASEQTTLTDSTDAVTQTASASRRRARLLPVDQILSIRPDIDLITLLTHASQNLAALNMMAHDLVHRPDEVQRARIVAMHQLAGLAEMLVSSALSKLDPLQQAADSKPVICH